MSSLSYVTYAGDGVQKVFTLPFAYLSFKDIYVFVNGLPVSYTFINGSTLSCTTAPPAGSTVQIRRVTQKDSVPVDFVDGSVLLETDLDTLATYTLYVAQENAEVAARVTAMESTVFGLSSGTPGFVYRQRFNGNGVAVAFVMAVSVTSDANIDVFISGVYQNHDTFSVSGRNLYFTEAPPDATVVEIRLATAVAP